MEVQAMKKRRHEGIVAGINAAQYVKGKEPFILDRSEAYIGRFN